MITSKENEKLKLIRRLADRKHRERERLFVAEGEDLVEAAAAAGWEPEFVLWAGEDVEPALLDAVSSLGSGTRVIGVYPVRGADRPSGICVYLHAISDPGNVGTILRSTHALLASATVVLGPRCADPYGPRAVRASMGSIFAQPVIDGGLDSGRPPRVGLVAHGGEPPDGAGVGTVCLGAERTGLPDEVRRACDRLWTIPLAQGGAESLNVAAAAAIALGRISSAAAEPHRESSQ